MKAAIFAASAHTVESWRALHAFFLSADGFEVLTDDASEI
jgi:hypothetical protein